MCVLYVLKFLCDSNGEGKCLRKEEKRRKEKQFLAIG
jgi:hypothetical protein